MTWNLKKVSDNQIMKQRMIHSMSRSKQDFYDRLKIIKESAAYQKIEKSFNDLTQSLNEWYEAKQRYFRMCKDNNSSNEERASQEKKHLELKKVFESKRAKLMEIFQAKSPTAIPI